MEAKENTGPLFPEFPPVTREAWEAQILTDLKGADYNKKLVWKTYDGLSVQPYYRKEDLESISFVNTSPGDFPFVRGNKKTQNNWEIRQDIFTEDPASANLLAVEAIRQGAEGIGFHIARTKEVEEMRILLDNIDLDSTAIHFLNARHYPSLLDLFIKHLDYTGQEYHNLSGSLNYDPIGYALLHGDFYRGKDVDLAEAPEMIRKVRQEIPGFRVINVNGQHFHHAGSTIVQEIAWTLASGLEYLSDLSERGLRIEEITPHLQFTLATGSDYFLEIAKIRAIRLLWARIVEQFSPSDTSYCRMSIHATTSRWNKTLYDPYVNILRTTTEAMSAAIAGVEVISVGPFDLRYKNTDEFSYHIARNQQIILKEESWLDKVADPAAGSYYIESLTEQLAASAWALFQETEAKGGLIQCMESGIIQDYITASASVKEEDIATKKIIFLGTNQYPNQAELMRPSITKPKPVAGIVKETAFRPLQLQHATSSFEAIRLATEDFVARGGKKPLVFLFTYGNLAMQKARASFITNFFACAGFEILDNPGFETIEEGVQACQRMQPDLVVYCSSDDEYPALVAGAFAPVQHACPACMQLVAGQPTAHLDSLKQAGIQDFIHIRRNILTTLTHYQEKLGIC